MQYCKDYRDSRNKGHVPATTMKECLDTLSRTQYFSPVLDLAAEYCQVELHPEDLFEYQRMSFGLCNAPATFQRIINLVLHGLTLKEVLAYLDDVIVLGKEMEEATTTLGEVFQ